MQYIMESKLLEIRSSKEYFNKELISFATFSPLHLSQENSIVKIDFLKLAADIFNPLDLQLV